MRIAALFCGLVAGLFALLAPTGLGTDLLTQFLKLWGPSAGQQMLGTVAWYVPVGAAVLGGLLAFVAPGPGALLMGIAGLAWLGLGVADSAFFGFELLAPGVVCTAGALLAFLAGEFELRRRRAARRNRRETMRTGSERPERPLRLDPDEAPQWPERREPPEREEREDNEERAREEARAREAAFRMDPLTVPREEAPPRPSREIPLTLEDVVPQQAPEPRRRAAETIWPETPTARRSVFDREGTPDLQPRRSLFDRPATRVERAERSERPSPRAREPERKIDRDHRDDARDSGRGREREAFYDDEPAPRRNMVVWIAAANGLVLVVLGLVVVYMMVDRSPAPASSVVAEATDEAAPPAVPTPAAVPAPAAVETERLEPNVWPALALPENEMPTLPMSPDGTVATPAAPVVAVAPAGGGYADPFAYCSAVQTIDYVDNRYSGPRFTAEIAEALRVPMGSAPDRVSWRCVEGIVYACASFDWPVCAMTPTAQEMVEYCVRNPGVTRLLAPNGTWSCEGNRPRLPDGASWPVDARGFFPNAWIPVLPPQRPTG